MKFFKNIKNSIYGPDYYSSVTTKPFSYSFKYYLLFVLLISLVSTIILCFKVIPAVKPILDTVTGEILEYYPDELSITIKGGEASTNVQEPYFIKLPEEWGGEREEVGIENLLAINTKKEFSIEDFRSYNAVCYLAKKSLTCYDEDRTMQIIPLSEMPDMTIDENLISSLAGKIEPFLKIIYPLIALAIFLGLFIMLLFRLVYLLIAALLIWIVAKIRKAGVGYKKSYQLGIQLMTLPIIITLPVKYLLSLAKINLSFPFLFTILLILVAAVNLKPKAITDTSNIPS